MKKALGSIILGLGLLVPTATLVAQDHPMARHEWKDSENESWHRYLKERHIKDHEWDHASKREKANYWKWRDSHPDRH
jgi:hypothetical protein